ncbi:MAG: MCE family protein [Magnetococcales bacterium]|nr:MCE family protein [Magnetococcales bacterium]NGZ27580.1 MCE family protein [Magnetococcales bacterium]
MVNEQSRYRRLGRIGLIVSAILVVVGILISFTQRGMVLHATFTEVNNIRVGTAVTMAGMAIGKVVTIHSLDARGKTFAVTLFIHPGWEIAADSTIGMDSPGLLGTPRLVIIQGEKETLLANEDHIAARPRPPDLNVRLEEVVNTAQISLRQFESVMQQMEQVLGETKGTVSLLNDLLGQVEQAGGNNRNTLSALVGDTRETVVHLDQQLTQFLAGRNIGTALSDLSLFANSVERLSDKLIIATGVLQGVLQETAGLVRENRQPLNRMINDGSQVLNATAGEMDVIVHNLKEISWQLLDITRALREEPGAFLLRSRNNDAAGGEKK